MSTSEGVDREQLLSDVQRLTSRARRDVREAYDLIRAGREQGITYAELSDRADLPIPTIQDVLRGKTPGFRMRTRDE